MSNNINSRIIHKHDLEIYWLGNDSFIPLKDEFIIYDAEVEGDPIPSYRTTRITYPRLKIGDGVSTISQLKFFIDAPTSDKADKTEITSLTYEAIEQAKSEGKFEDIYIGGGDMPEGYSVQIDPESESDLPPSDNIVDKTKLTLGVHTDGLIYIFVDGMPVGNGIEI